MARHRRRRRRHRGGLVRTGTACGSGMLEPGPLSDHCRQSARMGAALLPPTAFAPRPRGHQHPDRGAVASADAAGAPALEAHPADTAVDGHTRNVFPGIASSPVSEPGLVAWQDAALLPSSSAAAASASTPAGVTRGRWQVDPHPAASWVTMRFAYRAVPALRSGCPHRLRVLFLTALRRILDGWQRPVQAPGVTVQLAWVTRGAPRSCGASRPGPPPRPYARKHDNGGPSPAELASGHCGARRTTPGRPCRSPGRTHER
jgi:hypothetical protein